MHGISSDDPNAGETGAVPENGERLASNGAAMGEKSCTLTAYNLSRGIQSVGHERRQDGGRLCLFRGRAPPALGGPKPFNGSSSPA